MKDHMLLDLEIYDKKKSTGFCSLLAYRKPIVIFSKIIKAPIINKYICQLFIHSLSNFNFLQQNSVLLNTVNIFFMLPTYMIIGLPN